MAKRSRPAAFIDDPLWYKDAVIYQLHIKSFFDSNNDGIGDFAGLISKLDYIAELGVNTLWLLPFYPSPRRDDGYDIAEYKAVHPDYGSLADALAALPAVTAHFDRAAIERLTDPANYLGQAPVMVDRALAASAALKA